MFKPCDICLEETCGGKHDCHCETCTHVKECHRRLHATIRITNKCTQKCAHCCFESGPESEIMMTVEESVKISTFISNNNIEEINLMGGEFFCNPNWFEIFSNLVSAAKYARIVTNGDWAHNMETKVKLATFASLFSKKAYFCISKDRWHTNKNVDAAYQYLKELGMVVEVATPEQTEEASIIPIGRSWLTSNGIYSFMGCYCHNPANMYSFLIDEEGNVYKCSFGVKKYANIDDYQDGGFAKRFKELNQEWYKIFIPSCAKCINTFEMCGKDQMIKRK